MIQKTNRGITLIALVITIIILLILAGITIAKLTENGLFEKAQQAKQKSEESQRIENETLDDYEKIIDNLGNTSDNIKDGIVDYWPLTESLKNQISNGAGDLIVYKVENGENPTFTSDGVYLNNIVLSTSNDYTLSNAYSIVFQIKATEINTWSHVIGKHIKVIQDYHATGLFMWNSVTNPIIISGNRTYMIPGKALYTIDKQSTIVITHTGSLMSVYSDGKLIGTIETQNNDNEINSKFYIGGSSQIGVNVAGYAEDYSPGYYKNVIIYNRAITEDEIKKLQEELK